MAGFSPVLILKYEDENSPGKKITKGMMEVIDKKKKTQKGVLKSIGDSWWHINKLFNYVVNLFSFRVKPEDAIQEFEDVVSYEETEIEESFKVGKAQSRRELKQVADKVVSTHRQLISRTYPPASTPGEYPSTRSGYLIRSISTRKQGKDAIAIGYKSLKGPTGDPSAYSQWLADSGRLSLVHTARAMSGYMKTQSNRDLKWEFTDEYF